MESADHIVRFFRAGHPCVRIATTEEHEATEAAIAAAMTLELPVLTWSASQGVRNGIVLSAPAIPDTINEGAALVHMGANETPHMFVLYDMIPHARNDPRVMRALRELIHKAGNTGGIVVLIDHDTEPPSIIKAHAATVELPLPDREIIEQVIKSTLRSAHRELKTKGLAIEAEIGRTDFNTIVRNLQGLSRRQISQIVRDVVIDDRKLSAEDLNRILTLKRNLLRGVGVLEAIEAPVNLEDIGGLTKLKSWLASREATLRDDAHMHGLRAPRGVLLLGVQGAGKSLAAKAIATAWNRPILRLDAGALFDKYVGESEAKLRAALRQAEMMAPVVLWIDEIEKAFASAGSSSIDGGLSRRMFGSLLTWMQEHRSSVFLAATANDIESLPPELLRKGRFDEIFFVDLPGAQARKDIFQIHLSKRNKAADAFNLDLLSQVSDGFSGAEIEQAVVSAITECFAANRQLNTDVLVHTLRNSPPLSVTMAEKMRNLRKWAEGRCVPAD